MSVENCLDKQVSLASERTLIWAGLTDVGNRDINEDRYCTAVTPDRRTVVFAIADGLGGQNAGEVAATCAIQALSKAVASHVKEMALDQFVLSLLHDAHQALASLQGEQIHLRSADSTIVILAVSANQYAVGNLGDSRLYRIENAGFKQESRDHSLAALLLDENSGNASDVRHHADRNKLVRTLSSEPRTSDVKGPFNHQAASTFMLCTDGWWEPLSEETMSSQIRASSSPALGLASMKTLIQAQADKDQDNFTAIVVDVLGKQSDS